MRLEGAHVVAAAMAVGAAFVLASADAEAYRPFDGTDADVAELGVFELELGPVNYYRQGGRESLVAPALILNLGILEDTELVVDADEFVALGKPANGASRVSLLDDDVLVKHVFREGTVQGKTGVSVAAEGGVLTPEVNGSSGSNQWGGSFNLITSYEWSWGAVHWNEWFEITRDRHADLFTGVILEGPHDWRVRPVAEVFYDKDFVAGQTESALVGAIWAVRESFALDVGVRGARVGDEYVEEVRLGMTLSIPIAAKIPAGATVPFAARRRL